MADAPKPVLLNPEHPTLSLPIGSRRELAQMLIARHAAAVRGLPQGWQGVLVVTCLLGASNSSNTDVAHAFGVTTQTIKRWMRKRAFAELRCAASSGLKLLLVNPLLSEALRVNPEDLTDPKQKQQNIDLRLKLLAKMHPSEYGGTSLVQINNQQINNNDAPAKPVAVRPLSLKDYHKALEQRGRLLEHDPPGSPTRQ